MIAYWLFNRTSTLTNLKKIERWFILKFNWNIKYDSSYSWWSEQKLNVIYVPEVLTPKFCDIY